MPVSRNDKLLLRAVFEKGSLSARGLELAASDIDQFNENAATQGAQKMAASGLLMPSEIAPNACQITDAGRRAIGNDPGR